MPGAPQFPCSAAQEEPSSLRKILITPRDDENFMEVCIYLIENCHFSCTKLIKKFDIISVSSGLLSGRNISGILRQLA